jgi:flagellar biosynthesis protein FlhF
VVCLDSYRVGAAEQWQRFGQLMGLPLHFVSEPEEFQHVVGQSQNELVLIDTAGISGTGPSLNALLGDCLRAVADRTLHVLLVLPAWLRARDAERVAERYGGLSPTALVVTKVDETHQCGGVLHAALPTGFPIAYLCDGPRVPEDVRDATVDAVVQTVFPDQT